jgi:hypothetical protein
LGSYTDAILVAVLPYMHHFLVKKVAIPATADLIIARICIAFLIKGL